MLLALEGMVRHCTAGVDGETIMEQLCSQVSWLLELHGQRPDGHGLSADAPSCLQRHLGRFWELYKNLNYADDGRVRPASPASPELLEKLALCYDVYNLAAGAMASLVELQRLRRNRQIQRRSVDKLTPESIAKNLAALRDDGAASEYEKVLMHVLDYTARLNLRKAEGLVYKERMVWCGGAAYGSHAWELVEFEVERPSEASSIKTMVYHICRREVDYDMWRRIMQPRVVESVVKHLSEAPDLEFPFLKRDYRYISFRNGVLAIAEQDSPCTFYAYGACPRLSSSVVSSKFIDLDIDVGWFEGMAQNCYTGWWDIPTPNFQSILDYQNWGCAAPRLESDEEPAEAVDSRSHRLARRAIKTLEESALPHLERLKRGDESAVPELRCVARRFCEELCSLEEPTSAAPSTKTSSEGNGEAFPVEVQRWLYVMLGRLLYPLGAFDNWQCVPFVKGVAGSGKSCIAMIAKSFFEPDEVGILSSNCETKFGLSALAFKRAWMCLEAKRDMALPSADFQSMVSGEFVSVAVKNQTARVVKWQAPGIMCGNETPGWDNSQGSIARRIVPFIFRHPVRQEDSRPDLMSTIERELAALIVKCSAAYRIAAATAGDDVWKNLPEYFKEERRVMQRGSDPLYSTIWDESRWDLWIRSSGGAERESYYTRFEDFESEYKSRHRNMKGGGHGCLLDDDKTAVPFKEAGISKVFKTLLVNGTDETGFFLLGIRARV